MHQNPDNEDEADDINGGQTHRAGLILSLAEESDEDDEPPSRMARNGDARQALASGTTRPRRIDENTRPVAPRFPPGLVGPPSTNSAFGPSTGPSMGRIARVDAARDLSDEDWYAVLQV